MNQSNVFPMNKGIDDKQEIEQGKPLSWWQNSGIQLGLMKQNDGEPTVNGATVILALALTIIILYLLFGWALKTFDAKDEQRANEMLLKTSARRADERTMREMDKRAELLEMMKKEGLYEKVPEKLKVFERSDADKDLIK